MKTEREFNVEVRDLYPKSDLWTKLIVSYEDEQITHIRDEYGAVWPLSIFSSFDREIIDRSLIQELAADRLDYFRDDTDEMFSTRDKMIDDEDYE